MRTGGFHDRVSGLDLPVVRCAAPDDRLCYRDRGNQPIPRTFCTYGNVRLRTCADLHFWQRICRAESSFVSLQFFLSPGALSSTPDEDDSTI